MGLGLGVGLGVGEAVGEGVGLGEAVAAVVVGRKLVDGAAGAGAQAAVASSTARNDAARRADIACDPSTASFERVTGRSVGWRCEPTSVFGADASEDEPASGSLREQRAGQLGIAGQSPVDHAADLGLGLAPLEPVDHGQPGELRG